MKFGIELIEQTEPRLDVDGVRGFSVKVNNVEKVKAAMEQKGIPIVVEIRSEQPKEHEVIYNVGGFRLAFSEHENY